MKRSKNGLKPFSKLFILMKAGNLRDLGPEAVEFKAVT
jgi:hypothetical protein